MTILFGYSMESLKGETPESRVWREAIDPYWSGEIGVPINRREMMQRVGTDALRKSFFDGIWTSILKSEILKNPDTNFVVTDCRFLNEISMLRSFGAEIWKVRRGELPEWWNTALYTNSLRNVSTQEDIDSDTNTMKCLFPDVHESEWEWVSDDSNFDHIIYNNSTVDDLRSTVKSILN